MAKKVKGKGVPVKLPSYKEVNTIREQLRTGLNLMDEKKKSNTELWGLFWRLDKEATWLYRREQALKKAKAAAKKAKLKKGKGKKA